MEISHTELPPPLPGIEVELHLKFTHDEVRKFTKLVDPAKFSSQENKDFVTPLHDYLIGFGFGV